MGAPKPLSPKQLKFVELYLSGKTATDAYTLAGYKATPAAARTNAPRLLANARVAEMIEQAREKGKGKAGVTAEWWFGRLKIESTKKSNSGAARVQALTVMGKAAGFLGAENVKVSGDKDNPVVVKADHEHRISLTAGDLDAVDRLVAEAAGGGVRPDGGPE